MKFLHRAPLCQPEDFYKETRNTLLPTGTSSAGNPARRTRSPCKIEATSAAGVMPLRVASSQSPEGVLIIIGEPSFTTRENSWRTRDAIANSMRSIGDTASTVKTCHKTFTGASVGYWACIPRRHWLKCSASSGKRVARPCQPEKTSCTGMSTSPVIASQNASQLAPYQTGNPRARLNTACRSRELVTPSRSTSNCFNRAILFPNCIVRTCSRLPTCLQAANQTPSLPTARRRFRTPYRLSAGQGLKSSLTSVPTTMGTGPVAAETLYTSYCFLPVAFVTVAAVPER